MPVVEQPDGQRSQIREFSRARFRRSANAEEAMESLGRIRRGARPHFRVARTIADLTRSRPHHAKIRCRRSDGFAGAQPQARGEAHRDGTRRRNGNDVR